MASTAFQFVQGNERLDWGVLVAINTERLVKETNVDTLQRVVENLAYARISRDEAALFTPEHIIHLFQLSQVVIQYLVFSQEALARMNIRLNERVVECQQVLEKTDKSRSALEEELQDAQKKVRAQRKTLVAYEYGAAAAGGVRASSPAAGDFHYCPMCGEEYRKRESLQSHMRKRHSSTGPLPTAAAAVEPYQNAPAASIAAYQNPPPPPPPPPTMDAAAVQPSMMSPLPHGGDSCCQHACDVKRLSERVDSLERSLASERALTERLQHDQLMMLLLQSNTQRGGAPVEAQPAAAAVPDHGQRHNIREDSAMRILSTVVTPPAPASVLPPHEAVPTPVNPVSQSAYNVSAIRSALVGADVNSVPIVPDIGASMEYNMTRQREVANNALLRQMAELEDEIRTLKKAPVSAGSASWLAPPPAPPATQPPAVPTVPGQPNAPVNATDATAQLRPTPSYSLQVSPSAHEAVTVPSAVVPTVSVAMPMPSASMSLPMTTAVASAGVLPSPSVALSAPSASMSLPMPSALPLSGPVASPSTALSVPSASMSLPVPAAVPSSGPTSSPSTALSMPSASVPLPTPSAVYPAQSASMSLPVPSTTAPTTSVSMPAPSSSMSLPLSASIVPVVSVSMPQQQRSATPLPMQSSVIPTVSVSMPVPSSNGALPAPTSASMSLPVPAARPSSSMLPVGSMALPVPTSSSLSLSSPTTVPSTIPSPSLALQTTSVALPAQMSVSPPSLGLPAQGTNISQHQSAVAPGASLSIYAPHIPAAVTPIPLTASSASPTVSSQVAHSTSGAPSFFSPTSPVGIDTTASLLTATTPGVPVMSAMAQRASSHDQSSSSSQLLPWDRPLPVPVASISQPAAPVTVVPPVFAQQGHSGQRVQSIVSTTSDQSTTSTQPPYMTGVRSTLPVFGGDATYPRPSTSGADSTASSLTAPGTGTGGVGSYFTSARPIDVPSSASWDRPAPSALPTPASQPSANYANMSYMLGGTAPPSVVPSVVVPTPSPSQGLLQAPQLSPSPSVGMRQSATNSNLAGIAAPSAMKTFRAVSSSSDD